MTETNKKLYIKTLRLVGFKSYSDSKVIALSPFSNVVVGPNGSGKSNFFSALEFVLGEREFSNLSHEQRQELLHEGDASDSVQTAFVEVVFDNSEGRLQLDTEEVVLRRSVGLKKDEFFVNGKHVPKTEISTLLESAGFSRSNPYYICRQGKVSELCTMSDAQRLALLKEVAGTNVYDSRRADSEKLLLEANTKSAKIDESIASISSRLAELQQEKEELEQFRELDRERRAFEYLLSDGEIKQSQQRLEALDKEKHEKMVEAQKLSEEVERLGEQVEQEEAQHAFALSELARTESEQRDLENKHSTVAKLRTRRELDVRDAEERQRVRQAKLVQSRQDLEQVEREIAEQQQELDAGGLRAELDAAKLALQQARDTVKRREQREEEIRAKQGRNHRFGSDLNQRNAWIESEIQTLRTNIQAKLQAEQEYAQQMESMKQDQAQIEAQLEDLAQRMEENEQGIAAATAGAIKARESKDQCNAKRKDLWKRAQAEEDESRAKEDSLKRAQQSLAEICPFAFVNGLRNLEPICQERNVDFKTRVHGPLYSLVTCTSAAYRTAVEVAAGNQLLHVVVDTDSTAAELMQGLVEKRAGRITFKPLNVLTQREQQRSGKQNRQQQQEEDDGDDEGGGGGGTEQEIALLKQQLATDKDIKPDDAFPLIDKVVFDSKFGPAVRAMLGKTLVCRNHMVASICSKKYMVDCVTLDGDQVSRRGALTGGYVDLKRNRLAASEELSKAQQALQALQQASLATKTKAREEDQKTSQLTGELENFETMRKHLVQTKHTLVGERARLNRALEQAKERQEQMRDTATLQVSRQVLEAQIAELEDEKKQPPALTPEERQELTELPQLLDQARLEEKQLANTEDELRARVLQIKTNLQENLLRRRDDLQVFLESSSSGETTTTQPTQEMEALRSEFDAITAEEQELKQEMESLEAKLMEERKSLHALAADLVKNRELEAKQQAKLELADSQVESLLHKHDEYVARYERASRKIREVGNLPQAELDKYKSWTESALGQALAQCNAKLKKFSSVNKKALDQFVSFSEQKQALVLRQQETKDADLKIRDLISHLDRAKDAAIILTFKQVSHNFREIFRELVPHGEGELRMVKGNTEEEESDEEDTNEKKQPSIGSLVGVSPRVSFVENGDTVPMKQLSGGQKALVALTLMFAIQRSDQAPFYLFDEIDQALDSNHRTAVAALIQRQARSKTRSAQFVTTTFRPEMVLVADRCFGIQFSHKVSSIGLIDKNQALKFIRKASVAGENVEEEEEEEEEKPEEEEEEAPVPKKTRRSSTAAASRKRTKQQEEEEEE